MRFSINDHSITPRAKGWGRGWPTDRSADMARVKADRSGTRVNVHKRISRLVDLLLDETERRGYRLDQSQTGGYNNRQIGKTGKPSNHSWGLAVDLNWRRNPERFDGVLRTDFPGWLAPLWARYGFGWGGNYRGSHKDPMHLEFMGAPEDADDKTAAAIRDLSGAGGAPPRPAPKTYVVKPGDTLFRIATRLHVPGGWKKLHALNLAVIPDPDDIKPGQKLKLP
jgi:hypothetical protein